MKKIISIFLSALMAVSVMAVAPISAGAEEVNETEKSNETILAEYFIDHNEEWLKLCDHTAKEMLEEYNVTAEDVYCEALDILSERIDEGALDEDESSKIYMNVLSALLLDYDKFKLYCEADDYDVYYYDSWDSADMEESIRIDEYLVIFPFLAGAPTIDGLYYIGCNDSMYSFYDACKMGFVDVEELAVLMSDATYVSFYKFGDVNEDGLLDINDVSDIQMYLTDSKKLSYSALNLIDYNDDGVVDINDATSIQIELAEHTA